MKPGTNAVRWATNANHPAGADPWSGLPCKVEPNEGKKDTGRLPEERPPAEETNWRGWAAALLLTACASMRALNWTTSDVTALAGQTGVTVQGMWDPERHLHYLISSNGPAVPEEYASAAGLVWAVGVPPVLGFTAPQGMAHDNNDTRGEVLGGVGGDQVCSSVAGAAWVAWAVAGAPALTWVRIEHDWGAVGRWVIVDSFGVFYESIGVGTNFAPVVADPGFVNVFVTIRHSHHPAALVHPGDPENQVWMALTLTEISTSTNGTNWTAAAAHGLTVAPLALAYSAAGTRWIAVLAGAGRIAVSVDNGTTWTESAPLPAPIVPIDARIASDGQGSWVIVADPGGVPQVYASVDNGDTWKQVFLPVPETVVVANFDIWYGDGRFEIASGTAPNVRFWVSLAAEER